MFSSLIGGSPRAHSTRRTTRLAIESLEDRATPAVTFDVMSDGQLLFINGDAKDNKLYVRADSAGNVLITNQAKGGKKFFDAQLPSLVTIEFHGNGGDDVFMADRVVAPFHVAAQGGLGNDVLVGGAGDDDLNGGDGNDQVVGGAGFDSVLGGLGNDVLNGGNDDDFLSGGDSNDQLNGGSGNDALFGDAGVDALSGGDGADMLFVDPIDASVFGGAGADYFCNFDLLYADFLALTSDFTDLEDTFEGLDGWNGGGGGGGSFS